MATIKAVVRNARADGFLPVYIRIVHKSKPGYIKTDKIVSPKGIAKSGEIIDPVVNEYCAKAIFRYSDMLNIGSQFQMQSKQFAKFLQVLVNILIHILILPSHIAICTLYNRQKIFRIMVGIPVDNSLHRLLPQYE